MIDYMTVNSNYPMAFWKVDNINAFGQFLIDQPDCIQIDMQFSHYDWIMSIWFEGFDYSSIADRIKEWMKNRIDDTA